MTLLEAVASGKKFRLGGAGEYTTYEEFINTGTVAREDILDNGYELAPDVGITITEAQFMQAWEAARVGTLAVKPANASAFYSKMAAFLGLVE